MFYVLYQKCSFFDDSLADFHKKVQNGPKTAKFHISRTVTCMNLVGPLFNHIKNVSIDILYYS